MDTHKYISTGGHMWNSSHPVVCGGLHQEASCNRERGRTSETLCIAFLKAKCGEYSGNIGQFWMHSVSLISYFVIQSCNSWLVVVSLSSNTATSLDITHAVCWLMLAVARRWTTK